MNYAEKLKAVREFISDNVDDLEQLCVMFDITFDDVVRCFPDKLVAHYFKVFPQDVDSEDECNEYEEEAWNHFYTTEE
jgi:hypothetical protein